MVNKLSGLIAAPFTPFLPNGEINYDLIPRLVAGLLEDGVSGAYISGTTGEGVSCSVRERITLMEAWNDAAAGRLKLIVHTGALALPDIRALAHRAQELGVFATSIVPPTYFRATGVRELAEFCRAAAAAAPELPFYYYHTMLTAPNPPLVELLRAVDGIIPNFAGIKFNSHNLHEYQNCMRYGDGRYDIVFGVDEFFAGALAVGAKAFIGSTYNYAAPLYHRLWHDFEAGNRKGVLAGMGRVCDLFDQLVKYCGIGSGKAYMLARGFDMGGVRPPLVPVPPQAEREIAEVYQRVMGEFRQ